MYDERDEGTRARLPGRVFRLAPDSGRDGLQGGAGRGRKAEARDDTRLVAGGGGGTVSDVVFA